MLKFQGKYSQSPAELINGLHDRRNQLLSEFARFRLNRLPEKTFGLISFFLFI